MRKLVSVAALTLALGLLVGCTTTNNSPDEKPISTALSPQTINPIVSGDSAPISAGDLGNIGEVNVYYAGLGYPTEQEQNFFTGEEKTESSSLTNTGRVLGIAYTIKYSGEETKFEPLKVTETKIDNIPVKTTSSKGSVTTLAGYSEKPDFYNENSMIVKGDSLTWGFVAELPKQSWNKDKISLSQTVEWLGQKYTVDFNVSTLEPVITPVTLEDLDKKAAEGTNNG